MNKSFNVRGIHACFLISKKIFLTLKNASKISLLLSKMLTPLPNTLKRFLTNLTKSMDHKTSIIF